ncbi:uncharacterized protein [Arachis hypogaea]|uniref:uncharacterized protein n=1 Tax=Arachis hypogaea TaxID=3818 RepID=UPI000DECA4FD|nr:uncharacterized protein LOC112709170 [Arachis hypogaea]
MTAGEAWSLINDVAEATQHVRVRSNPLKDVVEAPPSESSLTKVLGDMTTILTEMHKEQKAFYSIQAVQSPPSTPLKRSAAKFALANKSVITVVGIAEDILVVIKDLVFPVDFYVFEMCPTDNRSSSSILLGRPFLKIGDKTIKFNLEEAMRHPPEEHSVLRCDVINEVVAESLLLEKLLEVLRKHKKAIGWSLADIVGIDPRMCMHRIFLQEGAQPVRQPQRRLNPTILDVVKKEVTRLLDVGIIYLISNSEWVSPVQVVPKKSGITAVKKEDGEVVTTRVQNAWQLCIDYRRLNAATRKDHFPLPFIDQVLDRLMGKFHYCFFDGFTGYFQIHIAIH